MRHQRVLFIGGTGVISSHCVSAANRAGHEVTVLTRGVRDDHEIPDGVRSLVGDIRDPERSRLLTESGGFDIVVDFLAFDPEDVRSRIDLLDGCVAQYVFISSASTYLKPPARLPVTESAPLRNPHSAYARAKIACEDVLVAAFRERSFPATIVRPSHTYDQTSIPTLGRWTDIARMRAGKPVIVHGDGTTPWTITHARDFATAFSGLLRHPAAIGDVFHITGDHAPTWDQIYTWLAEAAGVEPRLVHVPSETLGAIRPDWSATLVGDKAHAMVFDNSKLKALVSGLGPAQTFDEGAREIVAWYNAHPERQIVDAGTDAVFDVLVERFGGR
ncbi:NAD-dependent epimerase/dehydratase family protein [Leifsonia shinshuensis]|uniref:NAD-dependent epimerase/dehydratase family protein n=1 Tax=Leifsonia shinshuensis TaxID=150026 RepID=UPI0028666119|nr:NAD-dependent epimerase/dehydratase family protein [Leifsonia shinshuensis]MDR6972690.1 nucleoside-diphosphate-sugar epimerase [Leifsonia shinshuensis]